MFLFTSVGRVVASSLLHFPPSWYIVIPLVVFLKEMILSNDILRTGNDLKFISRRLFNKNHFARQKQLTKRKIYR